MRLADVGFRLTLSVALGVGGGLYLDRRIDGFAGIPVFTLLGFFAGLAAGLWLLVRGVASVTTPPKRKDPGAPDGG